MSVPASPMIVSSPRSPRIVSLPAFPERRFAAPSPESVSAPVPPIRFSKPASVSVPAPPVTCGVAVARLTVSAPATPE